MSLNARIAFVLSSVAFLSITAPLQSVFDQDHAVRPEPREDLLEVARVARLSASMNARSIDGSVGSARSVSIAGAILSSMRWSTPPRFQPSRAIAVPLLADVAAQQLAVDAEPARDAQRRVPGKRADLDRLLRADRLRESVMNAPCSGEICIIEKSDAFERVSLINHCWTSSIGAVCAMR